MPSGYAAALVQSIVALAGVCALAVFLLRLAASRGLGRAKSGRAIELVERLALDRRSAVAIVRVGKRSFLVGTSDGSSPTLVAELGELPELDASSAVAPSLVRDGSEFRSILGEANTSD